MNTTPFEYGWRKLTPGKVYGILDPTYGTPGLEHYSFSPHYGMYIGVKHTPKSMFGDLLFYYPWQPTKHNPDGSYGGWGGPIGHPAERKYHFLPLTTFAKKFPGVPRPHGFQTSAEVIAQAQENRWALIAPIAKARAHAWAAVNNTRRRRTSLRRSTRKSK